MGLTLILANKAYSSWSFRPWILMRHVGILFDDVVIPLDQETTRADILRYAPNAKCPSLRDGDLVVWDSLAIIEYLAESFPPAPIWPSGKAARATARALAAEMHSGFAGLRSHLPMNMRRPVRRRELTQGVQDEIVRIEQAFAEARERFGAGGPFLFGTFSAADAMFAPVVNRLHIYDVPVTAATRAYMDAMMALPAWQEWERDAQAELWRIARYEEI